MTYSKKDTPLLCAALLGLILAALSGMSEHVPWLNSWCASFSGGCRETARFTLLRAPLWAWGAGFYALVIAALLFMRKWLWVLIPFGIGVEITLLAIMGFIGAVCVFCLGNAVAVLLLAILFLSSETFWRALALTLLAFVASVGMIGWENGLLSRLCPPQTLVIRGGAPASPDASPPAGVISLAGSQILGPANAPVTVIEYTDFRCPACRKVHATVEEAMKLYGRKVRWVFKNFPLPMHRDARVAAEGALCAAEQGGFWGYQDALFTYRGEFTPDALEKIAADLKLNAPAFRHSLDSGSHRDQVEFEIREGIKVGINAVPTFIINGKISSGAMPLADLRAQIDEALEAGPMK